MPEPGKGPRGAAFNAYGTLEIGESCGDVSEMPGEIARHAAPVGMRRNCEIAGGQKIACNGDARSDRLAGLGFPQDQIVMSRQARSGRRRQAGSREKTQWIRRFRIGWTHMGITTMVRSARVPMEARRNEKRDCIRVRLK